MMFLNPILLASGLVCVAIPIAIHILMRRRRKPIAWGAMRFLLEAYRHQRKRTRLEQILLLAARCLLVALLALAMGRPQGAGQGEWGGFGPRTIFVVIDNSLAAGVRRADATTELAEHKAAAGKLLKTLSAARGDRAGLVSMAGPAEAIIAQPSADIAGVISALNDLPLTQSAADLPGGLARVREQLTATGATTRSGTQTLVALFSAWRTGTVDLTKPIAPIVGEGGGTSAGVSVAASLPADREADNGAIVDVEALSPLLVAPPESIQAGEPLPVRADIQIMLVRHGPGVGRAGSTKVTARLLGASGKPSAPAEAQVNWAPGQDRATVGLTVEATPELVRAGPAAIVASIEDDAIAGDNSFARPVVSRTQVKVGIVAPRTLSESGPRTPDQFKPADWIELALSPEAVGFDRRSVDVDTQRIDPSASDPAEIALCDALVITRPDLLQEQAWTRVRQVLDAGGLVVVSPPEVQASAAWATQFATRLGVSWTPAAAPREAAGHVSKGPAAETMLRQIGPELDDLLKPIAVARVWPVEAGVDRSAVVLTLDDGTPAMLSGPAGASGTGSGGRGWVVFMGVAPDLQWSSIPAMPIMVPLMQEILRQGLGRGGGAITSTAGAIPPWPTTTDAARAVTPEGSPSIAAEISPGKPVRTAGVWRAMGAGGRTLGLLGVNPDTAGSRTDRQQRDQVGTWLGGARPGRGVAWMEGDSITFSDTKDAGDERSSGVKPGETPYDLILLGIAGLIAVLELALGRWFSHAAMPSTPGLSASATAGGIVGAPVTGAEVAA
ncbi:MAG: BatA domain-containing protein [Planctomycetota bacterium]